MAPDRSRIQPSLPSFSLAFPVLVHSLSRVKSGSGRFAGTSGFPSTCILIFLARIDRPTKPLGPSGVGESGDLSGKIENPFRSSHEP